MSRTAHPSGTVSGVTHGSPGGGERIRAAEVIAALSLATDLGIGVPLEHGLQSALFAMRLSERWNRPRNGVEGVLQIAACYVGCTAGAETAAELFDGEAALTTQRARRDSGPVQNRWPGSCARSLLQAARAGACDMAARKLPRAAREFKRLVPEFCEVGEMLSDRLGLSASIHALFVHFTERWDGKGTRSREGRRDPAAGADRARGSHTAFQRMLGGDEFAARVVRQRAGGAFDPAIAGQLADDAEEILALEPGASVWESPRVRAEPSRDAGRRDDRPGPGRNGELRRSRVSVPGRPLGRSGGARDRRRATVRSRRSRGRRVRRARSSTTWAASRCRCSRGRSPRR